MKHRVVDSPVGPLTLVVDDAGALTGLYTHEQRHRPDAARLGERDDTVAQDAVDQLADWFAGRRRDFDLDLRAAGTEFQRAVWAELARVPFGQTTTYGQVARALGHPAASRAVGAAVGRNPISIVVPCHRVVGSAGRLTGYAGGLDRKRWLLDHEAAAT